MEYAIANENNEWNSLFCPENTDKADEKEKNIYTFSFLLEVIKEQLNRPDRTDLLLKMLQSLTVVEGSSPNKTSVFQLFKAKWQKKDGANERSLTDFGQQLTATQAVTELTTEESNKEYVSTILASLKVGEYYVYDKPWADEHAIMRVR